VSGVLTDETGSPVAGARVLVDYIRGGEFSDPPASCHSQGCFIAAVTDGGGHYDIAFEPGPGPIFLAEGAGVLYSVRDGYQTAIQLLPRGAPEIVQNLRLHRSRTVTAGQSFMVSIEPQSSSCSDLEDWYLLNNKCEEVDVLTAEAGRLTIEGRPVAAGGIIPVIFFATTGRYTSLQVQGPGTVSVGVEAGERYRVFVGSPNGAAARYDVTTSVR
jgi:hypothetical protein